MQTLDGTDVPLRRQDCKIFIKDMWEAKKWRKKDSALHIIHRQEYIVLNISCGSSPSRSERTDNEEFWTGSQTLGNYTIHEEGEMRIGTRDVPILYFFLFKMHQYVKKKRKKPQNSGRFCNPVKEKGEPRYIYSLQLTLTFSFLFPLNLS